MAAELGTAEAPALRVSRVGKRPVEIPSGVKVDCVGQKLTAQGPKGTLTLDVHSSVVVQATSGQVSLAPRDGSVESYAQYQGLTRALVRNILEGVSKGYSQALDLIGERLDEVAAGQRVGGVGDAAFVADDLLRAQCDARRPLGGRRP